MSMIGINMSDYHTFMEKETKKNALAQALPSTWPTQTGQPRAAVLSVPRSGAALAQERFPHVIIMSPENHTPALSARTQKKAPSGR